MTDSNRSRLKIQRSNQRKTKFKHGETKREGSAKRGYKTLYWNQKTGSWQSTKPKPLVNKVDVKGVQPKTRAQKLESGGFADLRGGKSKGDNKLKDIKKNYKPRAEAKVIQDKKNKTPYKPRAEAKVIKDKQSKGKESKGKDTLKGKPVKMHAIEKRNRKKFGDAHVDKLKAAYAKFKKKRSKK